MASNEDPATGTPAAKPPPPSEAEKSGRQPDAGASPPAGPPSPGKVATQPDSPSTAPAAGPPAKTAAQADLVDPAAPLPPTEAERYFKAKGGKYAGADPARHNLLITVANLRARSKCFLNMRDDQWALWSAGRGTRGVSIRATKDPVLSLNSFLINAREMYLETFADSTETQIELYVYTPQDSLRGHVDLPPGASVTLQTRSDRTSVIGLSSFEIEF